MMAFCGRMSSQPLLLFLVEPKTLIGCHMMQLDPHAVAGEAEPSPRKGRSLERAALRARDAEGRQSGTGGVHANGAEVRHSCNHRGYSCLQVARCHIYLKRSCLCWRPCFGALPGLLKLHL